MAVEEVELDLDDLPVVEVEQLLDPVAKLDGVVGGVGVVGAADDLRDGDALAVQVTGNYIPP